MKSVVLASFVRTPIGRAVKGSLRDVRPDDLVARAIAAAVERSGIPPELLDDHVLGTGYPEGKQGSNLARRASLLADLGFELPGATVSRFCASSMQAARNAVHAIQVGDANAYLVSGVESVSQVGRTLTDEDKHPALSSRDSITDVYVPMGVTAENVAKTFGISREDMDAFALRSHQRAVAAREDDWFRRDLLTVQTPDALVASDDGPRPDTTLERLAALSPAFHQNGSVTAGNSCPLNDGAAAAVLVEERLAERLGLPIRARIVASAVSAVDPALMGVGPIEAVRRLLERTELSIAQIDVIELNEAFASQVLAVSRELGVDIDAQLNPQGGAIALGHPFGMTGLRIIGAAVQDLEQGGGRYAIATLCVGGGQGMAILIERP